MAASEGGHDDGIGGHTPVIKFRDDSGSHPWGVRLKFALGYSLRMVF